uniref:Transcription initiation factor IIA subunit 2 n=1 Tax=Oryzias sinensis TaxID=183150 RepID=A0A8C7XCS3_9TELE
MHTGFSQRLLGNFQGSEFWNRTLGQTCRRPIVRPQFLCFCAKVRRCFCLCAFGAQTQQITPQLALQVLLQFDKAINTALANRVRNRVNFRGSLNTYRFCDNVWTFVLNDVEFREVTDLVKVDKVKIVACDGKNSGSNAAE